MRRQWVTTRHGDRVDAGHAFWAQHRFADGAKHGLEGRHLLELAWEDKTELLAVFLDEADCVRGLDAFTRQGWLPVRPDPGLYEGRAVNAARIRTCRAATDDAGRTWRTQLDVAVDGFPQQETTGLTREQALHRVRKLTEGLEDRNAASWVDPDFTRAAWRTVTIEADGWRA